MLAHSRDPWAQFGQLTWRTSWAERTPHRDRLRRCSYCGSVHPEDLLDALNKWARLRFADWKYGWPHKFYVEGVPNELAGQTVEVGSTSGPSFGSDGSPNLPDLTPEERLSRRFDRPIMGEAGPYAVVKFYNEHLLDAGEHFKALQALIAKQARILFELEVENTLRYRRAA